MVISGNIRGNGKQLAQYLVTKGENIAIWILEVDGRENADKAYLKQTIISMELMAEMTKSRKAYFHAEINPAYGEDKQMTNEQWKQAADILGHQLGYHNQRRVIVMHYKKDRIHAHVVFERYNYATGKMIDNKHSRLKMDSSRKVMEQVFGHKRTPHRNINKTAIKDEITALWKNTQTGGEFIKAARKKGYMISEGMANRPFMVVDKNGRSFNLVRQIDGVRTKDVRARLRDEKLLSEREAIALMRKETATNSNSDKQGKQQVDHTPKPVNKIANSFAENRNDISKLDKTAFQQQKNEQKFDAFANAAQEMSEIKKVDKPAEQANDSKIIEEEARKNAIARSFAENQPETVEPLTEKVINKQQLIAQQKRIRQKTQQHKHRR